MTRNMAASAPDRRYAIVVGRAVGVVDGDIAKQKRRAGDIALLGQVEGGEGRARRVETERLIVKIVEPDLDHFEA